jgi:hypothetical protein
MPPEPDGLVGLNWNLLSHLHTLEHCKCSDGPPKPIRF